METIFILLLFVAPGMLIQEVRGLVEEKPIIKQSVHEYLFMIVVDSIVTVTVTLLLLYWIGHWEITTIEELVSTLIQLDRLAVFSVAGIIVAIFWCIIKKTKVEPGILYLTNRFLKRTQQIEHTAESTVWDHLLNKEGIRNTWQVVSIYKDGDYISSGMLTVHNRAQNEEKEILLEHSRKVEQMKQAHPEWFEDWYDYYNVTSGLRVVFYRQKTIEEHWNEYYPEEPTS